MCGTSCLHDQHPENSCCSFLCPFDQIQAATQTACGSQEAEPANSMAAGPDLMTEVQPGELSDFNQLCLCRGNFGKGKHRHVFLSLVWLLALVF